MDLSPIFHLLTLFLGLLPAFEIDARLSFGYLAVLFRYWCCLCKVNYMCYLSQGEVDR